MGNIAIGVGIGVAIGVALAQTQMASERRRHVMSNRGSSLRSSPERPVPMR